MFKELEVSGTGVALTFLGLILLTIGLIIYFRRRYRSFDTQALIDANKNVKSIELSSRTKYPEMDVFKNSGSFFNYGIAAAVGLSLAAMSWTTYEKKIVVDLQDLVLEEEVEVDIPRTAEPPPPPPPPPPPVIQEVPDTEIIEDKPEFVDNSVQEETKVDAPVVETKKAPPPPPPPPPPAPHEEEIFKVVEQMPRFPGCEDKGTEKEKEDCAKTKMLEYIYKNLKYPAIARENGVEGQVVLQFVVDKDGSITDTKIVRDIGAGCGEAASTAVTGMNNMGKKWIPGKQRGRPVRVLYTLPVKFKLEG
ncbi:MAG: TonB family protein [Saprospiraceae bacterium]|jgi:protein TonB|nr:TonB family protein [Saprospiraceae bacterium]MBK7699300.1 TonB family protein [Saprospiraceae bacterium]MBK8826521.1 TonB family protein [Saprospiraceae bacterium]MBK9580438.1 TonB family protein [Saprospiraceae bacterium]MBP8212829.1 TonB family protein [Saprospiraceae bacterium]